MAAIARAQINTPRLVLKNISERDIPVLTAEIGNWEVARWLSSVPHPYTENDARNWVAQAADRQWQLNIYRGDALIGGIGLMARDEQVYELGFWLGQAHWGMGYATEAGAALLRHAREVLDAPQFVASYVTGNTGSARVLHKLGFTPVGAGEIYMLSRQQTVGCVHLSVP